MSLPPPAAAPVLEPPCRLDGPVNAWVIANPSAGRGARRAAIDAAVAAWSRRGWAVTRRWTAGRGDATAIARAAAAAGADIVAVAGGDGTLNEAANGLVGSRAALAVLPSGTANVLAAQLGLVGWPSPLRTPDLSAAADALAAGRVQPIDVGLARPTGAPPRHFVMWAGVGLDAEIVRRVEGPSRRLKARGGPWAFAAAGWHVLRRTPACEAVVRVDGRRRRVRLLGAVISNIPLYAGLVHLAPEARLDDGVLDAAWFEGTGRRRVVGAWLAAGRAAGASSFGRRVVFGRPDPARPLAMPVRTVRIVSRPAAPVHVDAEPCGTTPVRIDVVPGALRIVVPHGAPAHLFVDGGASLGRLAADVGAAARAGRASARRR